jgi:hypothetical protein
MPKNRKRNNRKGAKSLSIRTKFKIGGRKSSLGVKQMSDSDLIAKTRSARPRDLAMINHELHRRGIIKYFSTVLAD